MSSKSLEKSMQAYRYERTNGEALHDLLQRNKSSRFGEAHGFSGIKSVAEFRANVPLRNYAEIEPWIMRAADGEPSVLTTEAVLGFELTSGSTGGIGKLIPWTKTYQNELASALARWFFSWKKYRPEVLRGAAYWSISPGFSRGEKTAGGLPIGFDNDAAYFPPTVAQGLGAWLMGGVLPEMDGFFERTLEALLKKPLSLISVWSPTFFLRMDEAFQARFGSKTWKEIFPDLAMLSCWTDAQSAPWAKLAAERASVPLEPKGLAATEGVTSIPFGSRRLVAEGIHFHEFRSLADDSVCESAEVEAEKRYEVILTTGAGLWRYRTGDVVVFSAEREVEFVGRLGVMSDLAGEKLAEEEVLRAFRKCDARGFVAVDEASRCYRIFCENRMGNKVTASLRTNPHFTHAMDLGQITVKAHALPSDWLRRWENWQVDQKGTRLGDVKAPVLLLGPQEKEVSRWLT